MAQPLVSPNQLAQLRAAEVNRMVDLCSIIHRDRVEDDSGGRSVVTTQVDNVPCWREENLAGNTEQPFGGRLVSGLQWLFVLPYGTVIENDDEILYGSERFAVMGVLGPRSLELARRVIAVEK